MEAPDKAKYYEREELDVSPIRSIAQEVLSEVSRVIVGNGEILQQLFIALLVNGHVLLEGVPGLGKTVMAKTFAKTLGISFRRVQFTPDLLPADITGTKIFDQRCVTPRQPIPGKGAKVGYSIRILYAMREMDICVCVVFCRFSFWAGVLSIRCVITVQCGTL